MAVTGIGTYASYTNSYGNTQNAGNKTGRTYKNAHEYKNYLTQKYDCLRSRDYSVNINSSLLSKAMGDEKTKQWLEYNLSLIPKTIEQSRAYVAARGAKILSYSITINGYDSMSSVMCTQDEVDPRTEKARKELEERLEKRKAEKKETEERLEKQRAEKQEQEERQYNLKIEISCIPRDLIIVIFYYQISLKPLKTLSLAQVSFPLLFPLCYIVPPVFTNSDKGKYKGKKTDNTL